MKIKCIRLLNDAGQEIEFSPWLTLGRVYHVLSIGFYPNWRRNYGIVTSERAGEWPVMGSFSAECFEISSTIVPSNWDLQVSDNPNENCRIPDDSIPHRN